MAQILGTMDANTLKNVAMGLSGASLLVAILLLAVVKSIVGKIISLVIFISIAAGGYTQRASITDCVDRVKAQATAGTSVDTKCTFFGQEVTVKVPLPAK